MIYCKNLIRPHALENIEQYGGKVSPYSLNSDQRAFWRCFSNFTKHIWEFTWEKETVLTAKEAKPKNTFVTALRNYKLVVMKAAFYFYKNKINKVQHLLLAWQCSLCYTCMLFTFTDGCFPFHKHVTKFLFFWTALQAAVHRHLGMAFADRPVNLFPALPGQLPAGSD